MMQDWALAAYTDGRDLRHKAEPHDKDIVMHNALMLPWL